MFSPLRSTYIVRTHYILLLLFVGIKFKTHSHSRIQSHMNILFFGDLFAFFIVFICCENRGVSFLCAILFAVVAATSDGLRAQIHIHMHYLCQHTPHSTHLPRYLQFILAYSVWVSEL